MQIYDFVVIGSGGASYIADMAMETKHSVLMVEASAFGGTCLNRGCIPTKIMVHAADLIRMTQEASAIALDGEALTVNWQALKERVFAKTDESNDIPTYYQDYENIVCKLAKASFLGKETQDGEEVFRLLLESAAPKKDGEEISQEEKKEKEEVLARKVVIANGGRTNVPSDLGLEAIDYLTSEKLFAKDTWPDTLPKSMIIIGGGDIGVEFAHIFSSFGVNVQLVQRNQYLVPKQDREVSERILSILEHKGITVHTNVLSKDAMQKDGNISLVIKNRETNEEERIEAESLFVCPGIQSNADNLHLDAIGLEVNEKGWIPANTFMETAVDNVYAMGDVNGQAQLRHKSNYEGQILAHNLLQVGEERREEWREADYSIVPSATFTSMQIARVGITEEEARKSKLAIKVGYLAYSATAQAYARAITPDKKEIDGFAKVIVEKDSGKILGVHILADEASSLIEPYTLLMSIGKHQAHPTNHYLNVVENMTVHPALSEVVSWAFESFRDEEEEA